MAEQMHRDGNGVMRILTVSQVTMEILRHPNSSKSGKRVQLVQAIKLQDGPLKNLPTPGSSGFSKADPKDAIIID